MSKHLMTKEPWPAKAIDQYSCIEDGDWGYLLVFNDASDVFDSEHRPTDAEIRKRWAPFFTVSSSLAPAPWKVAAL